MNALQERYQQDDDQDRPGHPQGAMQIMDPNYRLWATNVGHCVLSLSRIPFRRLTVTAEGSDSAKYARLALPLKS